MKEKISFSVEDYKIVEDNPNSRFAYVSLDFFASGENLHKLYVSEETLMRTSETIKSCPIVWEYDPLLDDAGTHSKFQNIAGFILENSDIVSKKLEDGRIMLSVVACIWKRYTGNLINFFKRDGGKKPISVEMIVKSSRDMGNGLTELLDFFYEGVTVLGTFVTPAIPGANATVLSFSQLKKEYIEDLHKEFPVNYEIPKIVKETARYGIGLRNKYGLGGTSMALSFSKLLDTEDNLPLEKIMEIKTYFPKKVDTVDYLLWGGDEGFKWVNSILEKSNALPEREQVTNTEKTEYIMEDELNTMAEDTAKSEETETPIQEKSETPEVEKKEVEKGIEKKFEFPNNFSLEKMASMLDDEEEMCKMAKLECAKGEFCDPSILMGGMFSKICSMAEVMAKMSEDSKTYMAENEALRKFKADVEMSQKAFAVDNTLRELSEKVEIPSDIRDEMVREAEKYSFSTLEDWKTYCKAKSFDFAIKDGKQVVKVGLPFTNTVTKKTDSLWS